MKEPLRAPGHATEADQSQAQLGSTSPKRPAPVDARPTAAIQLRLREIASNSAHTAQLKTAVALMNASPRALQMRSLAESANGRLPPAPQRRGAGASLGEPVQTLAQTAASGLPGQLRCGIESLSGLTMDHVRVHYNAPQPAQLHAHAYAQGADIFLAPGQEKHLPHEAWHVVQQAQGRVRPTMDMAGTAVNDNTGLEAEADAMGALANRHAAPAQRADRSALQRAPAGAAGAPAQRLLIEESDDEPGTYEEIDDELLEQYIGAFHPKVQEVMWLLQDREQPALYDAALTAALRIAVDGANGENDEEHDPHLSSLEDHEPPFKRMADDVGESIPPVDQPKDSGKHSSITRLKNEYISPRSPVYVSNPIAAGNGSDTWDDNRDAFVRLFNERVSSAMKSGHPDDIKSEDTSLSRIAWVIETLFQARTCVAVILSSSHLHIFANHHDSKLSGQMKTLVAAAQDLTFASKEYSELFALLKSHVLVNRGQTPKKQETIDRKTKMVERRLRKALQFINQFKITVESITVHEVNKAWSGRKKHGEMRAADAVASNVPKDTALSVDVGISKICCAKCELAVQALSSILKITFKVQEAHWQIYDTETGWPIPEFLKKNPAAMRAFLGDAAYAIYAKFPNQASIVIEGMKKKTDQKDKLANPSSKDTGYISSEDEFDGERDLPGASSGKLPMRRDRDFDDDEDDEPFGGHGLYDDDDFSDDEHGEDDENQHALILGYDEDDGTPIIAVPDEVVRSYLEDLLHFDHAYLSVVEGNAIASALNVEARVFNLVKPSTNGVYMDAHGNRYRGTVPQTLADGNCLLHGINLIRSGTNMNRTQVAMCRAYLYSTLDEETLRIQIEDMIRARTQGGYVPGLGPQMSTIMAVNRELNNAIRKERAKSKVPSDSVSSGALEDSGTGTALKPSARNEQRVDGHDDGTGLIAFNVVYGAGADNAGILLFDSDHYIRLLPVVQMGM